MFHAGDLQSGIGLAVQQSKAVLCFVHDDTETSAEWETTLKDDAISHALTSQTVALRLQAGSREAGFLAPVCPIESTPAIVVIKNGQVQTNLQSAEVSVEQLKPALSSAFGIQQEESTQGLQETEHASSTETPISGPDYLDLEPQPGQMRLPNNAYDALRTYTQSLLDDGKSYTEIFETQLTLLARIPIFKDEVSRLRAERSKKELSEYARSRLLRLPAAGLKIPGQVGQRISQQSNAPSNPSTTVPAGQPVYPSQNRTPSTIPETQPQVPSAPPPSPPKPKEEDEKQKAQRQEYIRMQRDRENAARAERERIKAQIKADREERRRIDELRKQSQQHSSDTDGGTSSGYARSGSRANANADVRIQVRTFDGSTLRNTFPASSNITDKLRPWIDGATESNIPYNLKLILTPLPNRTIEAGEEDTSLSDLGIVGSCTFVMVPVKGYVESYSGGAGLMGQNGVLGGVGSMVSGGYNFVSGTAGWALGGVKSILGYGGAPQGQTTGTTPAVGESAGAPKNVRIRTLADQRAEEGKDHQFYNGNQLNFEPNKDDEGKKD
ncbi:hypothetical protein H2200_002943 [Cladophialophora chaetospira]|uniref:UBX domain-containing protein n=1 Tax=Cladophialophora chaetospira TaxID=386627 RepID=A0AA38XGK1_9EURO|nr:hypothetical protein H2200_002943 [Cladophialophora chaetospira]